MILPSLEGDPILLQKTPPGALDPRGGPAGPISPVFLKANTRLSVRTVPVQVRPSDSFFLPTPLKPLLFPACHILRVSDARPVFFWTSRGSLLAAGERCVRVATPCLQAVPGFGFERAFDLGPLFPPDTRERRVSLDFRFFSLLFEWIPPCLQLLRWFLCSS